MAWDIQQKLKRLGFAVSQKEVELHDEEQLGMHPKLAFVYMEALAAYMASRRKLYPVTDNVRDHLAVTIGENYALERLAQALLEANDKKLHLIRTVPTEGEIERQMATIALQSVLPKDIDKVPVEKIIQLRKKHRSELIAFQTHIHDFVAMLDTIHQVDDLVALRAHLEVAYERDLKLQLDDLKKCLKSMAIDTVTSIFNIQVALPPFFASAGAALHLAPISPEIAGAGAIACSIFPIFRKKRAEIRETIHTSPAAYLFYTQEGLTPASVVSQVVQAARHMILGI